jgi:hypothetical protein
MKPRKLNETQIIALADKIQKFLDQCKYNHQDYARSAKRVEEDQIAHCLEGALYAAWKLQEKGIRPYLLDFRAIADDDHVVCVYKVGKLWGSIGKSSTTLLRGRPPMFLSVRDLVMSYVPFYFNKAGKLSLHEWCGPFPMSKFSKFNWIEGKKNMQALSYEMDLSKGKSILSASKLKSLRRVSKNLFAACYFAE